MRALCAGLLGVLRIPSVSMAAISIMSSSISTGFFSATLEPHLRQFNLTPVLVGLVFIVSGGMYAVMAPLSGYLCDHGVRPKVISALGNLLIASSYILMGPAPFIPLDT
ncbi:hypothetical protein B566_EDAN019101 [Ephemera danica]|nr:hypothetical protein B566_EDAN019101 [Ephemera danica]